MALVPIDPLLATDYRPTMFCYPDQCSISQRQKASSLQPFRGCQTMVSPWRAGTIYEPSPGDDNLSLQVGLRVGCSNRTAGLGNLRLPAWLVLFDLQVSILTFL